MPRKPEYKPLLFTTTLRTPERMKSFLSVLKKYDGKLLNDALTEKIAGDIISNGLYKPQNLSVQTKDKIKNSKKLSQREIVKILQDNPQNHKEAGFSKGWPSRFDTWFKITKELGFVFYHPREAIRFSDIGRKLADKPSSEFEQQVFLNAFAKYQSNNPFRRVLNENIPLILLLQVITKLNADKEYNNTGISRREIPLVIFWKDNDAENLYQRIKKIRKNYNYDPASEVILDICRNEIMEGKDKKRNDNSIMNDYPDEFIRKMRLTGLISLRGNGRFIDINKEEQKKIDYVLTNYCKYDKYDTEKKYFDYISTIDKRFFSFIRKPIPASKRGKFLIKWSKHYTWQEIKIEMKNLSNKKSTKDAILKYLAEPARLEFLTAIAVKQKFPKAQVIPNYPIDDEGLPTSTAGGVGDKGDIECVENKNGILLEVTLLEGRMQTKNEVWPIARHLEKFSENMKNSMCYFIAPSIFTDSVRQCNYLKKEENIFISSKTINEFLEYLEDSNVLYSDV